MTTLTPPAAHYTDESVRLYAGDCIEVMRQLPDDSVDAVVTDPPYGIRFMGKAWDGADIVGRQARGKETNPMPEGVGGPNGGYRSLAAEAGRYNQSLSANQQFELWVEEWATECLRVLKPGGHLLASGSPRTAHRLSSGIENVGFEIRDSIAWLYGSGFPKSLDVSKAIDKAAGAEREVIDRRQHRSAFNASGTHQAFEAETTSREVEFTAAATDAAREWQGWGTALKPAFEPIVVARKPLIGTVAANVLAHGTGALNIDGCRIPTAEDLGGGAYSANGSRGVSQSLSPTGMNRPGAAAAGEFVQPSGRWPANVILDESQAEALDQQSGTLTSGANPTRRGSDKFRDAYGEFKGQSECEPARGADVGGASRFFYTAKADSSERPRVDGVAHPTVKPLALMRWLVRLVTPPGGTVLEPFAGSGTTIEACIIEGFLCIAIEREPAYLPLIVQRITKPIEATLL